MAEARLTQLQQFYLFRTYVLWEESCRRPESIFSPWPKEAKEAFRAGKIVWTYHDPCTFDIVFSWED